MFIFFTALFILPMFLGLYYSFTKYSGLGEPVWIGLNNYVTLFNDKFLAKSITNTLQMTAVNLVTVLPDVYKRQAASYVSLAATFFKSHRRAHAAASPFPQKATHVRTAAYRSVSAARENWRRTRLFFLSTSKHAL